MKIRNTIIQSTKKSSFTLVAKTMVFVVTACLLTGCLSLEFDSSGDKQPKPISGRWYVACVYGGWWWTDDPSKVCKINGQDAVGGPVKDNGYRYIDVESNFLSLFASFITVGIAVPVYVECYEEKPRPRPSGHKPIVDL